MRSIWVRAGLGALAVFALGMMLYSAARATKAKAKEALLQLKSELDSGAVLAVDHLAHGVPFILDGQTLGHLTILTFEPGTDSTSPSLSALVALDREHLDAAMLATRPPTAGSARSVKCASSRSAWCGRCARARPPWRNSASGARSPSTPCTD